MPKIEKILTLEITPEQFLNSCSLLELQELDLLIGPAIERKSNRMIKKGDPNYHSKLEMDEEF